jgi:threonine synthase
VTGRRAEWAERCTRCGRAWAVTDAPWLCSCGGLLDLVGPAIDPLAEPWPYPWERVTLREAPTPTRQVRPGLWVKMEQHLPTGSFKARGAESMIGLAAALGVHRVIVDSSGNAARAVAACAERAGLRSEVFVPESTPAAKLAALHSFGPTCSVTVVAGDRQATAAAAQARVGATGAWYASHVHQPAFHHGVRTLAFELHDALAGEVATVVVPAGNGTLVLGLWLGFRQLAEWGHVARVPRLVAVQSELCAPLAGGRVRPEGGSTLATGIAIARPPRLGQVRAAVLASRGAVLTVSEARIATALLELAAMGIDVEPTAAVGWAALPSLEQVEPVEPVGPVVVVLTGG